MAKKKRTEEKIISGVIPYAKKPGLTSFSSLWSIKHALGTSKVGHTGTLDSFAEGLLVCLSGSMTHLVPHITSFTKNYEAVVCFGKTTDTLDPCGSFIQTKNSDSQNAFVPTKNDVEKILPSFSGPLLQVPPLYSALHVEGKRASDLARGGGDFHLEKREIFIYKNELLDFREASSDEKLSYALLRVTCSKGTYIRSLARDIAHALGTEAYLVALRRTQVGPFSLSDAALCQRLPEFTIDYGIQNEKFMRSLNGGFAKENRDDEEAFSLIRAHLLSMTPELSFSCGLDSVFLNEKYRSSYENGRPLNYGMFSPVSKKTGVEEKELPWKKEDELCVFYDDGSFAGMIFRGEKYPRYSFVVHKEKKSLRVFEWDSVLKGEFPLQWKKQGVSLSVGSFDGLHAGHRALLGKVVQNAGEKNLVPGMVTFRSSARLSGSGSTGFSLSVDTFPQRCAIAGECGLCFAVVIDFSPEFSKMDGSSFIHALCALMGLRVLVEGEDFKCGHRASLTMREMPLVALQEGFELVSVPDVVIEGRRVSSSFVRECVQGGNMGLAKKMLLRPYALDFSGFVPKAQKGGEGGWLWFSFSPGGNVPFSQVIPKQGRYEVQVTLSESPASEDSVELKEGGFGTVRSVCEVCEKEVRLLLPTEGMAGSVRALKFI